MRLKFAAGEAGLEEEELESEEDERDGRVVAKARWRRRGLRMGWDAAAAARRREGRALDTIAARQTDCRTAIVYWLRSWELLAIGSRWKENEERLRGTILNRG